MPVDEFSLSDFLRCFMEYAYDENEVKSFSPPNAPSWHLFLWHTRTLLLNARLPHAHFGGFSFEKRVPYSHNMMKAMEALQWICHVRHPDWRIVLYPKMYREPTSSRLARDPILVRTLEIAYAVAVETDGFLEL